MKIPVRKRSGIAGYAEVDEEFHSSVSRHKWNRGGSRNRYVRTDDREEGTIYLHHLILRLAGREIPEGMSVDHVDRNPYNNLLVNLRIGTQGENIANASVRTDNTSGFRCVFWNKRRGKFFAVIGKDCKRVYLGYFRDAVSAAIAVNKKFSELYPGMALPNAIP